MLNSHTANESVYTKPLSVRLQRNIEKSNRPSAALPRQPQLPRPLPYLALHTPAEKQLYLIDNKVRNAGDSLKYLLKTCCHSDGPTGSLTRGSKQTELHESGRAA